MTDEQSKPEYEGWAVVELMGHTRLAGEVREVVIAGAPMLRVDVPDRGTQYVSPGALYALTPVSEDMARAVVTNTMMRTPAQPWELARRPMLPEAIRLGPNGDEHGPWEDRDPDDHDLESDE